MEVDDAVISQSELEASMVDEVHTGSADGPAFPPLPASAMQVEGVLGV